MNRSRAWLVTWFAVGIILLISGVMLRPGRELSPLGWFVAIVAVSAALMAAFIAWGERDDV